MSTQVKACIPRGVNCRRKQKERSAVICCWIALTVEITAAYDTQKDIQALGKMARKGQRQLF